jgi:hypothetical protein
MDMFKKAGFKNVDTANVDPAVDNRSFNKSAIDFRARLKRKTRRFWRSGRKIRHSAAI